MLTNMWMREVGLRSHDDCRPFCKHIWHSVPKCAFVPLGCKIRWKDPISSCILLCVKECLLLNTTLIFRTFIWARIYLTIQFVLHYSQMFTTANHKGEKKGLLRGHTEPSAKSCRENDCLLIDLWNIQSYYKKDKKSLFSAILLVRSLSRTCTHPEQATKLS